MKVGIYFDGRNPKQWFRPWDEHYGRILELSQEAERWGAQSVWLSEHHLFDDGYLPQPLTLAAAIAARTSHLRIGTAVLIPALRKPIQLAEEAAVCDIISGGRLELGVGVGYRPVEFDAFGEDMSDRYGLLESRVEEVRRLWAEVITPGPLQTPVPLWGGFYGPRGAFLAGKLGMGLLALEGHLLSPYQDGLVAGRHAPESARMGGVVRMLLSSDPERAWPRFAPHLAYQLDSYNRHSVEGTGKSAPPSVDPERLRRARSDGRPPYFQILTPDEAFDAISAMAAGLPVEHVFLWSRVGAMPDDLEDEHVQLVASQLAPRLASA